MKRAEQRDRIVITLEQRQLFFVLMGILVLASGILVLGYAVGQRLAARIATGDIADPGSIEFSALDVKEETKDQVEFTFDETLKVNAPSVGRLERMRPSKKDAKQSVKESKATKTEKASSKAPASNKAKATTSIERKAQPKTASTKAETVAVEAMEVLRRLRNSEESAASAKGSSNDAPKADAAKTLAAVSTSAKTRPRRRANGGRYTIQVSAFQERNEAMDMVRRLRKKGHNPYLVLSDIPGRGRWYRVRVGKFATRKTATEYQRRLRKVKGLQPFISEI